MGPCHFVYIGPNEISVTDVDAVKSVLGVDGLPKGPGMTSACFMHPSFTVPDAGDQRFLQENRSDNPLL